MNYVEILNNLIKLEKEIKGSNIFKEEYILQLERRKKLYLRGYNDCLEQLKEENGE